MGGIPRGSRSRQRDLLDKGADADFTMQRELAVPRRVLFRCGREEPGGDGEISFEAYH